MVDNTAHLERDWGARIREHFAGQDLDLGVLAKWMLTTSGYRLGLPYIGLGQSCCLCLMQWREGALRQIVVGG